MDNYILNKCIKISFQEIDSDVIEVKLYDKKFKIRGDGVINLFKDVLKKFIDPNYIEDVIQELQSLYSNDTLLKTISFFQENKIILPYLIEYQKLNKSEYAEFELLNYFSGCNKLKYNNEYIIIADNKLTDLLLDKKLDNINNIEKYTNFDMFIILIIDKNNEFLKNQYIKLLEKGLKVLPIIYDIDYITIGPLNIDKYTPCHYCIENKIYDDNGNKTVTLFFPYTSININNLNSSIQIAKQELLKVWYGIHNSIVSNIILVDNYYLDISVHPVIKNYKCTICGSINE